MNATQLTALITPVVSAAVVAILNYLHHQKTRKVNSGGTNAP